MYCNDNSGNSCFVVFVNLVDIFDFNYDFSDFSDLLFYIICDCI